MEITSIYAQNQNVKTEGQFIPEKKQDSNFEDFISKAETKNAELQKANESRPNDNRAKGQNVKGKKGAEVANSEKKVTNEKPEDSPETEKAEAEKPETAETKKTDTETAETEKTDENTETKTETEVEAEKTEVTEETAVQAEVAAVLLNSQIVFAIAKELNVSPEEVSKILEKLNITAADLTDSEVLGSFVREFFGVSSNVELLNLPNVKEVFAGITEAVSKAVPEQVKHVESPAAMVVKAEVNTEVKTQEVSTADTEGLTIRQESAKVIEQDAPKQENTRQAGGQQSEGEGYQNLEPGFEDAVAAEVPVNDENVVVSGNTISQSARIVTAEGRIASARAYSPTEIINQVTEQIKADIKGSASEVKMLLRPESLGELTLKIAVENGIVTAQFTAESQRVKEIIESNFAQLQSALSQSGMNVGALSVSVSNDNENEAMQAYERERQKSARRIGKIISDLGFAVAEEAQIVSEEDVLNTQVNLTV
ncbi:MAG: flagellar hook-length control protein FliK [Clostridiales bacterium]|jgi:flagellar hook-length control protein FliK|nr:flagellar hook-length control protein FliK [Clostridiales bacterium]